jgi:peptidoglycan hydrolase-like protein with peptidoglycan-binding domain
MARTEDRVARPDGSAPAPEEASTSLVDGRPPRRRRLALAVVVVVVTGASGLGSWLLLRGSTAAPAAGGARSATGTATGERRTLLSRRTESGTLGYADSRTLSAASTGTVTWLPHEGSVVRRGRPLYAVDGHATVLMIGRTPAWRTLAAGDDDGPDVRELERNLVAMGYDPDGDVDVDGHFDWATRAAVERWQEDRGVDETGVVEPGDVVFLPAKRRVGEVQTSLGAVLAPGTPVFDTTSIDRVVTVDLDASDQSLVHEGDRVLIDLPGGTTTPGRVTDVGRVATSTTDDTGASTDPTVAVTIEVLRPGATGTLDQAPVDVEIVEEARHGVLTVPVSALLARAGGRFAVETVTGSRRRMVDVTPGLFADGYVEVEGLAEGTRVVVPR